MQTLLAQQPPILSIPSASLKGVKPALQKVPGRQPHLNASALHLPSPKKSQALANCCISCRLHGKIWQELALPNDVAGLSAFSHCRPDLVASSTAVTASCGGSFGAFPFSSS